MMTKHVAILGDLNDEQLKVVWQLAHDWDLFYATKPAGSDLFRHMQNEILAYDRHCNDVLHS